MNDEFISSFLYSLISPLFKQTMLEKSGGSETGRLADLKTANNNMEKEYKIVRTYQNKYGDICCEYKGEWVENEETNIC